MITQFCYIHLPNNNVFAGMQGCMHHDFLFQENQAIVGIGVTYVEIQADIVKQGACFELLIYMSIALILSHNITLHCHTIKMQKVIMNDTLRYHDIKTL